MFSRLTGKSDSSQKRRRSGSTASSRQRGESIVSSNSTRKPSRNEEHPTPLSRNTYPPIVSEATASSYATAPELYHDPNRNDFVSETYPRARTEIDDNRSVLEDDRRSVRSRRARSSSRDRKKDRRDRSRSRDRDEKKKDSKRKKDDSSSKSRKESKAKSEIVDSPSLTRAGDSYSTQAGAPGYSAFPGQDGAPTTLNAHPSSAHDQYQYSGQNPPTSSAPSQSPYGAAASYYGDQGQSVMDQPGIRPDQGPVNADPHLMTPTAMSNPPLETGNGTANDFYSGKISPIYTNTNTNSKPSKPSTQSMPGAFEESPPPVKPPRPSSSKPSKVNGSSKPAKPGKLNTAAVLTGGAALGYALGQQSSHGQSTSQNASASGKPSSSTFYQQHSNGPQGSTDAFSLQAQNGDYDFPSPEATMNVYGPSASGAPSKPGKQSSQSQSNLPMYAAGAAGLAAGAYGLHQGSHHQHSSSLPYGDHATSRLSPAPFANGPTTMRHQHKGPISKFVDWWKDYEDVRKMEEYTEYIGVCRDCFDPRSSASDAPRKHHYHQHPNRKRSNEYRRGRIDKDSRYYSSDNDYRRKSSKGSWLATGLAGYGIAKAGKSFMSQKRNGFDDTYSVKSGRYQSNSGARSRSRSRDRKSQISYGVTGRYDSSSRRDDVKSHKSSRRSRSRSRGRNDDYKTTHPRSRSRSKSRSGGYKAGLIGAAMGAAAASVAGRTSKQRSRSNSPNGAFVRRRSRSRDKRRSQEGLDAILGLDKSNRRRDSRRSDTSSFVDISRPTRRQSNQGLFASFFAAPEKKEKRHKVYSRPKKQKGFFTFSNSSSSSSESGLAYGAGFAKARKPKRKSSDEKLNATLAGLGATAAALAATQHGRGKYGSQGRRPEVVAVKDNRRRNQRSSRSRRSSASSSSADEDGWEDLPEVDDDSSSVDSGLHYGDYDFKGKGKSTESLASNDSGTSKWFWRWGRKDKKKKPEPPPYNSHQDSFVGPAAVGIAGAAAGAALGRHGSARSSASSVPAMQNVYPVQTSDPYNFDAGRTSSQPLVTSRPDNLPLQQPQPVQPVKEAVYTTSPSVPRQSSFQSTWVQPSGPPVNFNAGSSTPKKSGFGGFVESPRPLHDVEERDRPQLQKRVNSSPGPSSLKRDATIAGVAGLAAAAGAAAYSTKRRQSAQSPSSVRFNLTDEERERDRKKRKEQDRKYEERDRNRRETDDRFDDRRREIDQEKERIRKLEEASILEERERTRKKLEGDESKKRDEEAKRRVREEESKRAREQEESSRRRVREEEEHQHRIQEEDRQRRAAEETRRKAEQLELARQAELRQHREEQHAREERARVIESARVRDEEQRKNREQAEAEARAREERARLVEAAREKAELERETDRIHRENLQAAEEAQQRSAAAQAESARRQQEADEARIRLERIEREVNGSNSVQQQTTGNSDRSWNFENRERELAEREKDIVKPNDWKSSVATAVAGAAIGGIAASATGSSSRDHDSESNKETSSREKKKDKKGKKAKQDKKSESARVESPKFAEDEHPEMGMDKDYFAKRDRRNDDGYVEPTSAADYVKDMDARYREVAPNPAEFFAPEELKNPTTPAVRQASPNGDIDLPVYNAHAPSIVVVEPPRQPPYDQPYTFTPVAGNYDPSYARSAWSVPSLALIVPTPPASRTNSVTSGRSPSVSPANSPVVEPRDTSSKDTPDVESFAEPAAAVQPGVGSSRVTWGDDQFHHYVPQTPESFREQYITNHELNRVYDRPSSREGVTSQPGFPTSDPGYQAHQINYSTRDPTYTANYNAYVPTNDNYASWRPQDRPDTEEVVSSRRYDPNEKVYEAQSPEIEPVVIEPDRKPQRVSEGFYQQPFVESFSDFGAPEPEVRSANHGYVEGEITEEPDEFVEAPEMAMPGGFIEEPKEVEPAEEPEKSLNKRERRKLEKAKKRDSIDQTSTSDSTTAPEVSTRDVPSKTEDREPSVSKKEKKKRHIVERDIRDIEPESESRDDSHGGVGLGDAIGSAAGASVLAGAVSEVFASSNDDKNHDDDVRNGEDAHEIPSNENGLRSPPDDERRRSIPSNAFDDLDELADVKTPSRKSKRRSKNWSPMASPLRTEITEDYMGNTNAPKTSASFDLPSHTINDLPKDRTVSPDRDNKSETARSDNYEERRKSKSRDRGEDFYDDTRSVKSESRRDDDREHRHHSRSESANDYDTKSGREGDYDEYERRRSKHRDVSGDRHDDEERRKHRRRESERDKSPSPSDKYKRSTTASDPSYKYDDDEKSRHHRRRESEKGRSASPSSRHRHSAAASEPGDLYESSRKSKRRSKRDGGEFDDAASVASSPAKYDEDKKEKSRGLLSLLSGLKSTDSLVSSKSKSKDLRYEDDDPDKKRKKKHRSSTGGSTYGSDDEDRKSERRERRHRSGSTYGSDDDDHKSERRERKHRSGSAYGSDDDDRKSERKERKKSRDSQKDENRSFLGERAEETNKLPVNLSSTPASKPAPEFHSIEELYQDTTYPSTVPLPSSGPPSPLDAGQPLDKDLPQLPPVTPEETAQLETKTPPSLSSLRAASTTAIPFSLRRPPLSPSFSRGESWTVGSSADPTPSTSPDVQRIHSRGNSTELKRKSSTFGQSAELRPLYLLERTRKVPEVDESLPALPLSVPSSRSPSLHGSSEGNETETDAWESAVEHPDESGSEFFHSPEGSRRGGDSVFGGDDDQDFLDSQQATPKASEFPADVQQSMQEGSSDKQLPEHPGSPRGLAHEKLQRALAAESIKAPRKAEDEATEESKHLPAFSSQVLEDGATAIVVGGSAAAVAHQLLKDHGKPAKVEALEKAGKDDLNQFDQSRHLSDANEDKLREPPIDDDFMSGSPNEEDMTVHPTQFEEKPESPSRPPLSRKSSKKGKKVKGVAAEPGMPKQMSLEDQQTLREQDAAFGVESWYEEPATPKTPKSDTEKTMESPVTSTVPEALMRRDSTGKGKKKNKKGKRGLSIDEESLPKLDETPAESSEATSGNKDTEPAESAQRARDEIATGMLEKALEDTDPFRPKTPEDLASIPEEPRADAIVSSMKEPSIKEEKPSQSEADPASAQEETSKEPAISESVIDTEPERPTLGRKKSKGKKGKKGKQAQDFAEDGTASTVLAPEGQTAQSEPPVQSQPIEASVSERQEVVALPTESDLPEIGTTLAPNTEKHEDATVETPVVAAEENESELEFAGMSKKQRKKAKAKKRQSLVAESADEPVRASEPAVLASETEPQNIPQSAETDQKPPDNDMALPTATGESNAEISEKSGAVDSPEETSRASDEYQEKKASYSLNRAALQESSATLQEATLTEADLPEIHNVREETVEPEERSAVTSAPKPTDPPSEAPFQSQPRPSSFGGWFGGLWGKKTAPAESTKPRVEPVVIPQSTVRDASPEIEPVTAIPAEQEQETIERARQSDTALGQEASQVPEEAATVTREETIADVEAEKGLAADPESTVSLKSNREDLETTEHISRADEPVIQDSQIKQDTPSNEQLPASFGEESSPQAAQELSSLPSGDLSLVRGSPPQPAEASILNPDSTREVAPEPAAEEQQPAIETDAQVSSNKRSKKKDKKKRKSVSEQQSSEPSTEIAKDSEQIVEPQKEARSTHETEPLPEVGAKNSGQPELSQPILEMGREAGEVAEEPTFHIEAPITESRIGSALESIPVPILAQEVEASLTQEPSGADELKDVAVEDAPVPTSTKGKGKAKSISDEFAESPSITAEASPPLTEANPSNWVQEQTVFQPPVSQPEDAPREVPSDDVILQTDDPTVELQPTQVEHSTPIDAHVSRADQKVADHAPIESQPMGPIAQDEQDQKATSKKGKKGKKKAKSVASDSNDVVGASQSQKNVPVELSQTEGVSPEALPQQDQAEGSQPTTEATAEKIPESVVQDPLKAPSDEGLGPVIQEIAREPTLSEPHVDPQDSTSFSEAVTTSVEGALQTQSKESTHSDQALESTLPDAEAELAMPTKKPKSGKKGKKASSKDSVKNGAEAFESVNRFEAPPEVKPMEATSDGPAQLDTPRHSIQDPSAPSDESNKIPHSDLQEPTAEPSLARDTSLDIDPAASGKPTLGDIVPALGLATEALKEPQTPLETSEDIRAQAEPAKKGKKNKKGKKKQSEPATPIEPEAPIVPETPIEPVVAEPTAESSTTIAPPDVPDTVTNVDQLAAKNSANLQEDSTPERLESAAKAEDATQEITSDIPAEPKSEIADYPMQQDVSEPVTESSVTPVVEQAESSQAPIEAAEDEWATTEKKGKKNKKGKGKAVSSLISRFETAAEPKSSPAPRIDVAPSATAKTSEVKTQQPEAQSIQEPADTLAKEPSVTEEAIAPAPASVSEPETKPVEIVVDTSHGDSGPVLEPVTPATPTAATDGEPSSPTKSKKSKKKKKRASGAQTPMEVQPEEAAGVLPESTRAEQEKIVELPLVTSSDPKLAVRPTAEPELPVQQEVPATMPEDQVPEKSTDAPVEESGPSSIEKAQVTVDAQGPVTEPVPVVEPAQEVAEEVTPVSTSSKKSKKGKKSKRNSVAEVPALTEPESATAPAASEEKMASDIPADALEEAVDFTLSQSAAEEQQAQEESSAEAPLPTSSEKQLTLAPIAPEAGDLEEGKSESGKADEVPEEATWVETSGKKGKKGKKKRGSVPVTPVEEMQVPELPQEPVEDSFVFEAQAASRQDGQVEEPVQEPVSKEVEEVASKVEEEPESKAIKEEENKVLEDRASKEVVEDDSMVESSGKKKKNKKKKGKGTSVPPTPVEEEPAEQSQEQQDDSQPAQKPVALVGEPVLEPSIPLEASKTALGGTPKAASLEENTQATSTAASVPVEKNLVEPEPASELVSEPVALVGEPVLEPAVPSELSHALEQKAVESSLEVPSTPAEGPPEKTLDLASDAPENPIHSALELKSSSSAPVEASAEDLWAAPTSKKSKKDKKGKRSRKSSVSIPSTPVESVPENTIPESSRDVSQNVNIDSAPQPIDMTNVNFSAEPASIAPEIEPSLDNTTIEEQSKDLSSVIANTSETEPVMIAEPPKKGKKAKKAKRSGLTTPAESEAGPAIEVPDQKEYQGNGQEDKTPFDDKPEDPVNSIDTVAVDVPQHVEAEFVPEPKANNAEESFDVPKKKKGKKAKKDKREFLPSTPIETEGTSDPQVEVAPPSEQVPEHPLAIEPETITMPFSRDNALGGEDITPVAHVNEERIAIDSKPTSTEDTILEESQAEPMAETQVLEPALESSAREPDTAEIIPEELDDVSTSTAKKGKKGKKSKRASTSVPSTLVEPSVDSSAPAEVSKSLENGGIAKEVDVSETAVDRTQTFGTAEPSTQLIEAVIEPQVEADLAQAETTTPSEAVFKQESEPSSKKGKEDKNGKRASTQEIVEATSVVPEDLTLAGEQSTETQPEVMADQPLEAVPMEAAAEPSVTTVLPEQSLEASRDKSMVSDDPVPKSAKKKGKKGKKGKKSEPETPIEDEIPLAPGPAEASNDAVVNSADQLAEIREEKTLAKGNSAVSIDDPAVDVDRSLEAPPKGEPMPNVAQNFDKQVGLPEPPSMTSGVQEDQTINAAQEPVERSPPAKSKTNDPWGLIAAAVRPASPLPESKSEPETDEHKTKPPSEIASTVEPDIGPVTTKQLAEESEGKNNKKSKKMGKRSKSISVDESEALTARAEPEQAAEIATAKQPEDAIAPIPLAEEPIGLSESTDEPKPDSIQIASTQEVVPDAASILAPKDAGVLQADSQQQDDLPQASEPEAPTLSRKQSKKEKRKAKKEKASALSEPETTMEPTGNTDRPQDGDRVQEPSVEAREITVDGPSSSSADKDVQSHIEQQLPQPVMSFEEPEISNLPRSPAQRSSSPHDIDFSAAVAAGLEESGFDSKIITEDQDFWQRSSPPPANVDPEPEEIFNTTSKKKKGKKGKQSRAASVGGSNESPAPEPIEKAEARGTEKLEQPKVDDSAFDTVVAAGLAAAGFAAASGRISPTGALPVEPEEEISWQKRPKRGKKADKSQPETPTEKVVPEGMTTDSREAVATKEELPTQPADFPGGGIDSQPIPVDEFAPKDPVSESQDYFSSKKSSKPDEGGDTKMDELAPLEAQTTIENMFGPQEPAIVTDKTPLTLDAPIVDKPVFLASPADVEEQATSLYKQAKDVLPETPIKDGSSVPAIEPTTDTREMQPEEVGDVLPKGKGKEGKRGRKGSVAPVDESTSADLPAATNEGIQTNESLADVVPPSMSAEDSWDAPTRKKSKKGKKAQRESITADASLAQENATVPEIPSSQSRELESEPKVDVETSVPASSKEAEEFLLPEETRPITADTEPALLPKSVEPQYDLPSSGATSVPDSATTVIDQKAAEDRFQTPSRKKSKKGKKGQAKALDLGNEDKTTDSPNALAEDYEMPAPTFSSVDQAEMPEDSQTHAEVNRDAIEAKTEDVPADSESRSKDAIEAKEGEEDIWAEIPSKGSKKKSKKAKKSQPATPIEEVIAKDVGEEVRPEGTGIGAQVQEIEPAQAKEGEDPGAFSVSREGSKKRKKGKKASESATPSADLTDITKDIGLGAAAGAIVAHAADSGNNRETVAEDVPETRGSAASDIFPGIDRIKRRAPTSVTELEPKEKRVHLPEFDQATPNFTADNSLEPPKQALHKLRSDRSLRDVQEATWAFPEPDNRDSALHVEDSPRLPQDSSVGDDTRDSGYHDTPDLRRSAQFTDATMEEIPESQPTQREPTPEPVRTPSPPRAPESNHPTREAEPDWELPVKKKRQSHEFSPAPDFTTPARPIAQSREEESPQLPSGSPGMTTPSAVDSTTKQRASYLFKSSPSVQFGTPTESPTLDRSRETPKGQSTSNKSTPGSQKRVMQGVEENEAPQESLAKTGDATHSVFGDGPIIDAERAAYSPSPMRHLRSPSVPLDTIREYSPEESPLSKKSRDISDVGAPERGLKARRRAQTPLREQFSKEQLKSPPRTPLGRNRDTSPLSTDELIDKLSWPEVDDKNETVSIPRHFSLSPAAQPHGRSASGGFDPVKQSPRPLSALSDRFERTPEHVRPLSSASNRSSTPSLRRVDRSQSGDLRAQARLVSEPKAQAKAGSSGKTPSGPAPQQTPILPAPVTPRPNSNTNSTTTYDPKKDKGKGRAVDMADVYEGWGDVQASPLSPTRPPSVRKRQSMQIIDLEAQIQLMQDENKKLQEAKARAEESIHLATQQRALDGQVVGEQVEARDRDIRAKDAEIAQLTETLRALQEEVNRLTQINEHLTEANTNLTADTNERYATLQSENAHAKKEWQASILALEALRAQHSQMQSNMDTVVRGEINNALAQRDAEISRLNAELQAALANIERAKGQILASKEGDSFLTVRDEDYFDSACQQLCQHVQSWVMRFSKYSDKHVCRLSSEIKDDKIEGRLDNAILDGSEVDDLLADRQKRRDVFMSVVMTMVWEFVFTRYLFGMDREQRQKLKALEKQLADIGPPRAVAQWRAITLTLLSKRDTFQQQRTQDTEAVVHEIYTTLAKLLPPPRQYISQIQDSLRNILKLAITLSIEMRTQRAEYVMLPPLQPDYDTNGDLIRKVHFNASLMNERSGETTSNEALQQRGAVVRLVLFPLVVKKGDDVGEGQDEIVVCPAQVLVARPKSDKKVVRVRSGALTMGGSQASRSVMSVDMKDADDGGMF